MGGAISLIGKVAREKWRALALWGLAVALLYQVVLMAALILRFGKLPNYIVWYDWPGNVARIVRKTPSYIDMPPIIAQEWLVEIGFMNRDFGNGISEWALNVVPANLVALFVMGALLGLAVLLSREGACAAPGTRRLSGGVNSLGAGLVLMTNATMSWVVCCATPTWVVGLAMLGLGVSTSLALESLGTWLALAGFGMLIVWILVLARMRAQAASAAQGSAPGLSPAAKPVRT